LENKWVFRRFQKTGKVCADVMSGGRLFQSRLPATIWPTTMNLSMVTYTAKGLFVRGQARPPSQGWGPNTPQFWSTPIYAHTL